MEIGKHAVDLLGSYPHNGMLENIFDEKALLVRVYPHLSRRVNTHIRSSACLRPCINSFLRVQPF